MQDIIKLSREVDLEVDYLEQFKRTKKVPNNLFYTSEGAESFYTYRGEDLHQISWKDEFEFFQRQEFWSNDASIAFLSLGCGNAEAEKKFLQTTHNICKSIDYYGIDSSSSMLDLAMDNLKYTTFKSTFILADFTSQELRDALKTYLQPYDVVIFAMIGGTFGNFNQSFIVNELEHLISSGSYLYLDVVPQYESEDANAKLRDRFSHLPMNLALFFKQLLEKLCIPEDSGRIYGIEQREEDVGANRHTFYFEANRRITFPCFGGSMTVNAGERLELLSIRAYIPHQLQMFLHHNDFTFLDTYIPDVGSLSHLWQRMLFRKV
jgi:SAM-dependent methyltransferase